MAMQIKTENTLEHKPKPDAFIDIKAVKADEYKLFANESFLRNRFNRLAFKLERDETLFSDICFWGGTHPEIKTAEEQRLFMYERFENEAKNRINDLMLNLSRRFFLYELKGEPYELDCGLDFPSDPKYRSPIEQIDVCDVWYGDQLNYIQLRITVFIRMKNKDTNEISVRKFPLFIRQLIGSCIEPQHIDERMQQLIGEIKNG